MANRKYNSRRFVLVFAALLSAFGPFMTDLYLTAFPELMEYFGTTTSLIQLSLTFGVIGLAEALEILGFLEQCLQVLMEEQVTFGRFELMGDIE